MWSKLWKHINIHENNNLTIIYECRKYIYDKGRESRYKTFYIHALRHYTPLHAQDTWDTYKLGVGIFTMKGFERRHLESKQVVRNHTNKKVNITLQSAKKLYQKYNT